VPAVQLDTVFGDVEHVSQHPPQCKGFSVVETSQPLAGCRSQSAKPAPHVKTHCDAAQVAVAFGGDGHALPHAPHWVGSLTMSTSQPFDGSPSQSAQPTSHVKPHSPATHVAAELCDGTGHTFPHSPQLARSVEVSVSHPFDRLPSQSE